MYVKFRITYVANGKVVTLHAMKAHCGGEGGIHSIAPFIFKIGFIWRLVANIALRNLYPRKKRHTLNRRLGGPHSRSGHFGEVSYPWDGKCSFPPNTQTGSEPVLDPAHVISYIAVFCVVSPGRVHNFIFVLGADMF